MQSNAYFLAKFRFDTAENEPAKNLQKLGLFGALLQPPAPKKLHRKTLILAKFRFDTAENEPAKNLQKL